MDGVDSFRKVLSRYCIVLEKREDATGILDQVDAFVKLNRDNERVQQVKLGEGQRSLEHPDKAYTGDVYLLSRIIAGKGRSDCWHRRSRRSSAITVPIR